LAASTITAAAHEVRSGYWIAFDTKGDRENRPLCGMRTDYADSLNSVMIKHGQHSAYLFVQIFKESWYFPQHMNMRVTLGFDRTVWGTTIADGESPPPGEGTPWIVFKIATASTISFLKHFQESTTMWIRFDEGNEKPWITKLQGSRDAVRLFGRCIAQMDEWTPTQPYGNAPTQPYGNPKSPGPPMPLAPPKAAPATGKKDDGSV
jgi:hypothetical protein